jgi:UDP-2,3-diacylglucosamine pyrophosphatase LpxH
VRRLLFCPDVHVPYHDHRAWALFLRAARAFRPHTLVVLGDFGDFYSTSRHIKNPNRSRDLASEVSACNAALDELDELGVRDKRFCEGNHENNLERFLSDKAPELFNVVSAAKLFRLAERGYDLTPYKSFGRIGKLYYSHEVGYCGERAHTQSANAVGSNLIIGHTHRLAVSYRSTVIGKHHVAVSSGWLGDAAAAEYMHRARTRDWHLGFSIGHLVESSGVVHVSPIPIIDYTCVIGGRLIRG